mgnify:FL=1
MIGKHVLIVDDAIELGRLLQSAVRTIDPDLNLIVVPSAEEAILASSRQQLNLLITDLRLPGMSGFELAERMRKHNPTLEVILITGMTDRALRKQAEEMGAGFFTKPLKMDEFLMAVQRSLGGAPASLPVEQPSIPAEPPKRKRSPSPAMPDTALMDVLTVLQQETGANVAVLFNSNGEVEMSAGTLSKGFSNRWQAAMLASLGEDSPLTKAAGSQTGARVVILRDADQDLLAAAVRGGILAISVPSSHRALRLALALEELLTAQAAMENIIEKGGEGVIMSIKKEADAGDKEAKVEEKPAEALEKPRSKTGRLKTKTGELDIQPSTGELESALKKNARARKAKDADAFWEQATASSTPAITRADVLSFDQAEELGLTPQQDEAEE